MKIKYIKPHNNYDLTIGKIYEGSKYKDGWILIKEDDKGNRVLYREECFEINKKWQKRYGHTCTVYYI